MIATLPMGPTRRFLQGNSPLGNKSRWRKPLKPIGPTRWVLRNSPLRNNMKLFYNPKKVCVSSSWGHLLKISFHCIGVGNYYCAFRKTNGERLFWKLKILWSPGGSQRLQVNLSIFKYITFYGGKKSCLRNQKHGRWKAVLKTSKFFILRRESARAAPQGCKCFYV